jgi:DNA sulfur modification protein DndB
MNQTAAYTFAALRGMQSGATCYTVVLPLGLVPRILSIEDSSLSPDQRVQRALNRSRVPAIAQYLIDNPRTWILPALVASVNSSVTYRRSEACRDIGELTIPMDARILVNDGQHRWAGIALALRKDAEAKARHQQGLAQDSITVLLYVDAGLERSQQLFADLNFNGAKPSKSLGVLYNHRDQASELARQLATTNPTFAGLVEMEKAAIGKTSDKLFTIGAIHSATSKLLNLGRKAVPTEAQVEKAHEFWTAVGETIPEWVLVRTGSTTPAEVRAEYVTGHAVLLEALGEMGSSFKGYFDLAPLANVNWRRSDPAWDGLCMVAGVMAKTSAHVTATANYLRSAVGLEDAR